MRKPIIGITASYGTNGNISMRPAYVDAIRENGGIGCLLSRPTDPDEIAALAADLDGLLFAGGDDIDPAYYGETVAHPSVKITPERDTFELALFTAFIQTGKPIFGICRGIQLMNVALGGSLHQHIEGHRQSPTPGSQPVQPVAVEAGTRLAVLVGMTDGASEMPVNTFHHQAVKVQGRGSSYRHGRLMGLSKPRAARSPLFRRCSMASRAFLSRLSRGAWSICRLCRSLPAMTAACRAPFPIFKSKRGKS